MMQNVDMASHLPTKSAMLVVSISTRIGSVYRMYCVCKTDIEKALDRFVDEYEDAPDVVDLKETQFADWDPPRKCDFCEEAAAFLVV